MKKKNRIGFLLLISLVTLSIRSCVFFDRQNPVLQFLKPDSEHPNDESLDPSSPCFGTIVLSPDYSIECSGQYPSILNQFSGSVEYNGTQYVKSAMLELALWNLGEHPYICTVELSHIAPGETVPISCQETVSICATKVYDWYLNFCELETYTDYLDAQQPDTMNDNQSAEGGNEVNGEGSEVIPPITEEETLLQELINLNGTWKGTCPSLLPDFYCMPDDADCTETNERTFTIDLNTMTYYYENPWSYYDPHDEIWEGTYDHCVGLNTSQGVIFNDGWMIGIINFDEKCEYTSWLFGTTEGDVPGLRQGERENHSDAVFVARILFDPEPAVVFTVYTSDQTFPIEEYTSIPEAFKRLINEYSTGCPITPGE
jgi:hypothetical protein